MMVRGPFSTGLEVTLLGVIDPQCQCESVDSISPDGQDLVLDHRRQLARRVSAATCARECVFGDAASGLAMAAALARSRRKNESTCVRAECAQALLCVCVTKICGESATAAFGPR